MPLEFCGNVCLSVEITDLNTHTNGVGRLRLWTCGRTLLKRPSATVVLISSSSLLGLIRNPLMPQAEANVKVVMSKIQRFGESARWSEVVIYRGEARWVEVADDATADVRGQIAQVLTQINVTLDRVGSSRTGLIQVLIFLADLKDGSILNELWDEWVPTGQLPIRACVEAKLAPGYFVEMVISAAVIG